MELRQLRYFAAVAEELHFAHAAERLHIAQQSLSSQIRQLEEELGTLLFERTTRRVELTAAGQALLKELAVVFEHLQKGVDDAQRAGRGEVGQLTVGYHSTTLYNIMPAAIRLFRKRYPDVGIILRETGASALEDNLLSGEIDIGISVLSEHTTDALACEVIYHDRVAVALPKGHRLEHCDCISLNMLADEPLIMYSRVQKPEAFDQIITLCQQSGFSPRIVQEATTEAAIISLVAGGVGVAIVLNSLHQVRADEVIYRPMINPAIEIQFGLIWRKTNSSPMIKAFVQIAQEADQLT